MNVVKDRSTPHWTWWAALVVAGVVSVNAAHIGVLGAALTVFGMVVGAFWLLTRVASRRAQAIVVVVGGPILMLVSVAASQLAQEALRGHAATRLAASPSTATPNAQATRHGGIRPGDVVTFDHDGSQIIARADPSSPSGIRWEPATAPTIEATTASQSANPRPDWNAVAAEFIRTHPDIGWKSNRAIMQRYIELAASSNARIGSLALLQRAYRYAVLDPGWTKARDWDTALATFTKRHPEITLKVNAPIMQHHLDAIARTTRGLTPMELLRRAYDLSSADPRWVANRHR